MKLMSDSIKQFVAAAAFFAERRAKADFTAFDRLMQRKSGEAPRAEDAL